MSGGCEICWDNAFKMSQWLGGFQAERYRQLLAETDHSEAEIAEYVRNRDADEEFWFPIVQPNGEWDHDQIMKELHDYRVVLEEVPKVYCHITGNELSKPHYIASEVITAADDFYEKRCREDLLEDLPFNDDALATLRDAGYTLVRTDDATMERAVDAAYSWVEYDHSPGDLLVALQTALAILQGDTQ